MLSLFSPPAFLAVLPLLLAKFVLVPAAALNDGVRGKGPSALLTWLGVLALVDAFIVYLPELSVSAGSQPFVTTIEDAVWLDVALELACVGLFVVGRGVHVAWFRLQSR